MLLWALLQLKKIWHTWQVGVGGVSRTWHKCSQMKNAQNKWKMLTNMTRQGSRLIGLARYLRCIRPLPKSVIFSFITIIVFSIFKFFLLWIQWLTLNRGWSYHLISRACVLQFLLVFHFQSTIFFPCNVTQLISLSCSWSKKWGLFCFPSSNKKHGTQFELWCLPPTQVCNFSEMMILATFFFQKRFKTKTKTRRHEDSKKRPHTKIRAKK